MFKLLKFIFIIHLLFVNVLFAQFTKQEKVYLKNHPIIKAHNETNWPPFNFNKNGVAQGFSIDYMNLLASKIGFKATYISGYSWDEFMNMLQTPKLDVIINISKNKQREKTINFSNVFISSKNAIYTNINSSNFINLEDLQNKTIAMPKGFFTQKFIEKNYPNIKQVLVKDSLEALKLLSLGKVDATIGKKVVLDYIIKDKMISNVVATNYVEDENIISHIRLGTSKKDKILINILKKGQSLVTNEEISNLKEKWFGAKMKTPNNINNINLTTKEIEYLNKKSYIKVCVDPDWMPFEKIENGKHIGLASDYMNIFSKKLNIPITLVETKSWSESLQKIKNRKCDILSLLSRTKERESYLNFTDPYLSPPIAIATKNNVAFIDNIEQIMDKKLGVVKGYSIYEILKNKYQNINLIEVNSIQDGLKKVANGKIFGYLDNTIVLNNQIQKNFMGIISINGKFEETFDLGVGTRNDEPILNEIFQKLVVSIDTKTKQKILNKWVSKIEYTNSTDYTLLWQIIFIFIVIILIGIFRHRELNTLNSTLEDKVNLATKELLKVHKLAKIGSWTITHSQNSLSYSDETYSIFEIDKSLITINKVEDFIQRIYPDDLEKLSTAWNKHILNKEKYLLTHRIITDTKKIKYVEERCETTYDSNNIPLFSHGTVQDVTEQMQLTINLKEKEKQLFHQSKYAQMGEMLSMIAHQWRQPLNSISLTSSNLLFKCIMDDMNKDLFEKEIKLIDEYSQHLSKTIDDFRDFFKEEKTMSKTNFEDIIKSTLNIVEISLKNKNINIVTKLNCTHELLTYPTEIKQVVLNLIKNAEDALIENNIVNPIISIESKCGLKHSNPTLIIRDNAGGINDNILDKIFDPYFSTKLEKDGTGLGLYMSKTIIENHCKGSLIVHNDKDSAVFTIILP